MTCAACHKRDALANSAECRTCWDVWWRSVVQRSAVQQAIKHKEPPCP